MSRLFCRIMRLSSAWTLAVAIILHAAVAFSMQRSSVSTNFLKNGLRVVVVEVPGAEAVSVRLLVDDGTLRVGRRQQHVPHLIEHLCFRELSANPDVGSYFRQQGVLSEAWTEDFTVGYGFDGPSSLAGEILCEIRRQWDEPFVNKTVRREAERVRHELMAASSDSYLMGLALEHGAWWSLTRGRLEHAETLDRLRTDVLWTHFKETYVGKRMTLIVVAAPQAIRSLEPMIAGFGEILAGEPAMPGRYDDLSWLTGFLGSSDLVSPNLFGLRFPVPKGLDALTRLQLRTAVTTHLRDRLALATPNAYDFKVSHYDASDSEVWIYNGYTDFVLDSRSNVHKAAESAFQWLASDSAQRWWQLFVTWDRASEDWWVADPMLIGDDMVEVAKLTPHGNELPNEYPWQDAASESLHAAYRDALRSATFFKLGSQSIDRSDESGELEEEEPLLVLLAWIVSDWNSEHPWTLRLSVVLSILLTVLLIRNRPRLDRTATSLKLQRRRSHERQTA